jgi:hypothetical protein
MFVFDEEFNWHAYESDSREAILDLLRKCSITDLMLVEIQKTFQFIIALLVPGWGPSWELLFLIPLVPICNKAIAAAQIQRETIIKPICIGLGFSLLPMLAAYPQPHGLVEQYVFLTSLFFLLSPILLSHLLKKFNWKDQANKT